MANRKEEPTRFAVIVCLCAAAGAATVNFLAEGLPFALAADDGISPSSASDNLMAKRSELITPDYYLRIRYAVGDNAAVGQGLQFARRRRGGGG